MEAHNHYHKLFVVFVITLAGAFFSLVNSVTDASGQSAQFEISAFTIDSGNYSQSTDEKFQLHSVAGQPEVGPKLSNIDENYQILSGFLQVELAELGQPQSFCDLAPLPYCLFLPILTGPDS